MDSAFGLRGTGALPAGVAAWFAEVEEKLYILV